MIDAGLLAECRTLATTVGPELASHPLYVCDSDVFNGLPTTRDCLGWANRMQSATSPLFKDRIPEWSAPGPVICLDGDAIRNEYGDDDFRDGVLATSLHEVAHLVPVSEIFCDDVLERMDPSFVHSWQLAKLTEYSDRPAASHAADHGCEFIRLALHCWFRATAAGWTIPIYRLFGPDCPVFLQPPHFLAALMGELTSMQTAPFVEIEAREPPAGFTELWTHSAPPPKEKT